jgi:hypothetical protein
MYYVHGNPDVLASLLLCHTSNVGKYYQPKLLLTHISAAVNRACMLIQCRVRCETCTVAALMPSPRCLRCFRGWFAPPREPANPIAAAHLPTWCPLQGPSMLNVRRLTALTELRLNGAENLAGDIPVAMLASCMPPDLAILQLATAHVSWPPRFIQPLINVAATCSIW